MNCKKILYCSSMIMLQLFGKAGEHPPCDMGNFSVPGSQQISPLISFGQNIIDQNLRQLYLFGDAFLAKNEHYIDFYATLLYGITDNFSALVSIPAAVDFKVNDNRSGGIEDVIVQFEYAPFVKETNCSIQ